MRLTGVVRAGRRIYDDPAALAIANRGVEGERFVEEFGRQPKARSSEANRRYWGVILPLVREVLDEDRRAQRRDPMDWGRGDEWKERLHDALVRRHAGVVETPVGPVRKSTRIMTTREFFEYTESVTRWLAELGWYVPEQGDD